MDRIKTVNTLNILSLTALGLAFLLRSSWPAWLAALLLAVGLWDNPAGRAIASGWMKFSETLGRFNTRLLLGLIFYLVLTPLAALYRLSGGKTASHFRKDSGASLFSDVEGDPCAKESFEKPW